MATEHDQTRDAPAAVWCIVVAGGSGRRFGSYKQFELLDADGGRVLDHSVAAASEVCDAVVVVVPNEAVDEAGFPVTAFAVVGGGATRSESVRRGLAIVPDDAEVVLVHDAARPLAAPELFARVRDAVRAGADAAVPAVPVTDTIRHVAGGVVDRDELRAVQTPQAFRADVLRDAHASAAEATDDAGLVEAGGGRVVLVEGERSNLKITSREDLVVARALLAARHDGGGDSTPWV